MACDRVAHLFLMSGDRVMVVCGVVGGGMSDNLAIFPLFRSMSKVCLFFCLKKLKKQ